MPESLLRSILTLLLKALFRVRIRGIEHFYAAGDRIVIICNHQSFLDPLLLAVFIPEKPSFAINEFQARKWYLKPLLKLVEVFRIDPSQPMTTKSVIAKLKNKGRVVIFPEGRITTTGGIMKIYDGTGMILDKTSAEILPIHIEGAQHSVLSLLKGKVKIKWFPCITLNFFPATTLNIDPNIQGKERRRMSAQWIYDLMTENMFKSNFEHQPILETIAQSAMCYGLSMRIAEDISRQPLSYRGLFTKIFALAEGLKTRIGDTQNVAVLLPTSTTAALTFLSLQLLKKTPAMLNFSAGIHNLTLACKMAQTTHIITSRSFIEKANLAAEIATLSQDFSICYLEDMRDTLGVKEKLLCFAKANCPTYFIRKELSQVNPTSPAVILYTSGSEGTPKGVVLSHENMLSNIYQAAARLSFTNKDVLLNALPIFHSFGLTIGTLLPLALGIRVFFYPSPLHYRVIPEIAYDINASILLGTDTFFKGYANYAHSFDFQSVRLAVAGAEKLKPETRKIWAEKFRVDILEGYGVTEASPAISFNTPLEHKIGSVGRPFPAIDYKLEPMEGLDKGGRLFVKGPNVMLGYLRAENPGVLEPAPEWYDTGDIVDIDNENYIYILGRAKRFAKIGGEMVSLTVIEDLASKHYPAAAHAALAVADARKGEQIILLTEAEGFTRELLLEHAKAAGLPEITIPKHVHYIKTLPRLGTGKIDYVSLKKSLTEPGEPA